MKLTPARRVTLQICILYNPENQYKPQYKPQFWKKMDSLEDEALFITQSSTNTNISAEIEGNRV